MTRKLQKTCSHKLIESASPGFCVSRAPKRDKCGHRLMGTFENYFFPPNHLFLKAHKLLIYLFSLDPLIFRHGQISGKGLHQTGPEHRPDQTETRRQKVRRHTVPLSQLLRKRSGWTGCGQTHHRCAAGEQPSPSFLLTVFPGRSLGRRGAKQSKFSS